MKKAYFTILFLFCAILIFAQQSFSFALFTDLHINTGNNAPAEDLQNAVDDVNKNQAIEFVLISGDITETGDIESFQKAKEILNTLRMPWYITTGNHDTKWTPSGGTDFNKIFGNDKFSFEHKGYKFIGFNTGPLIKMGDGHIYPQDMDWVENELKITGKSMPVFIITHYPLLKGDVDNWFEMTALLRKYNVQAVLCGHYHRNMLINFDQIPGVVLRSSLRGSDNIGGYSIFNILPDSLHISEKIIDVPERNWLTLPIEIKKYDDEITENIPSYSVNKKYKNVKIKWVEDTRMAIFNSPTLASNKVYYADDDGNLHCIKADNGKYVWTFKTESRVVSAPAVSKNKVIFGSTDGGIYCVDALNGKQIWKFVSTHAVMGSPTISGDTVYIGGSDGCLRAFDFNSGKIIWEFCEIKNYVETKPLLVDGKIIFGAWDSYLYALNTSNGKLAWKWNNGQERIHFSPAAVLPVAAHGKVFITAPDRFLTALEVETGKVVWRTNKHTVRETIGISADRKTVYSRCMTDSVLAVDAQTDKYVLRWKTNADFGYDHNPSMLVEISGTLIFGTKNGLICGVRARDGKLLWQHKVGNTSVNTITPAGRREFLMTAIDGKVARIKF